MVNILHIETSSKNCSVAISQDDEILCYCEESSENFSHNEKLHSYIEWVFEGAELNINDINAVAVGKGPGSYTGLRIGVAAAKGFCFGLDVPLIALNSLEIITQNQKNKNYSKIIPVMDARRMEIYTAVYDSLGNEIEPTNPHILNENSFGEFVNDSVCFIGDAVEKVQNFINEKNIQFKSVEYIYELPSSKNMVDLALKKYQNKEFENLAYFEPFYLKDFIGNKLKKYQ